MKKKSIYVFLDGKKHCDLVKWALGANKDIMEAKQYFTDHYKNFKVEFKTI